MADVTIQRSGQLMAELFKLLLEHPEGMQAQSALAELANRVTLTPYEAGSYLSGGRRFEKIVRFGTVDCVKAGWLTKSKGRWTVTEEGAEALKKAKDPEAFYRRATQLYRKWKAGQPEIDPPDPGDGDGKSPSVTYEQSEEQAWSEISNYLTAMQPYVFQELVADLLRAMDYHIVWVAPPGKDGGVDVVASPDPLGTRPPRIKVQVKRAQEAVRVDVLRAFLAMLGDGDVGLFVSAGGFTKDTEDLARTQEKRRVTLIDLEKLFDLWVEHYDKLTDEARTRLPLRPIYFLAPGT